MAMFTTRRHEPAGSAGEPAKSANSSDSNRAGTAQPSGLLSGGVSIKGSVKFRNSLLIDGEVEGTIDSTGTLTIGEHARIRGEITAASITVLGKVEGNILATERCE